MKYTTLLPVAIALLLHSCSGPIYSPNDLLKESEYAHLLENNNHADKRNFFTINDSISLYYFTKGSGENILMVHGGPGYPFDQEWKGLDQLTKDYKFYYYHQRGCGKSTRIIDKFTSRNFYKNMNFLNEHLGLPAQIADIEQIRRKIGQEKITIIGHSFGGFLAVLYAIEFPEHVKSLVLVSPAEVVKMPAETGGLYEIVRRRLSGDDLVEYEKYLDNYFDYGSLFSKTESQLAKENHGFIKYFNLATNNTSEKEPSEGEIGGWIQQACFLSMGKKHDYSGFLSEIQCPVMVIHGKEDIIPVSSNRQYLDHIPQAELKVIENASHFSFDEQPAEFGEILANFLGKGGT